jgi:type VI secretion system secreted protein Hcp
LPISCIRPATNNSLSESFVFLAIIRAARPHTKECTFNFTKELDKASPKLALACADGTHINNIVLEVCRAGGDKLKFMEYKLTNCIICEAYTSGAGVGDLPFENIKINFGKIEWAYVQQKRASGGAAGNIAAGWDLEKNCKV